MSAVAEFCQLARCPLTTRILRPSSGPEIDIRSLWLPLGPFLDPEIVTWGTANARISEPRLRKERPRAASKGKPVQDVADTDSHAEYEFGGPLGVAAMMIGFPLLMWYMFVGAVCYNGRLPLPARGQPLPEFARHIASLAYTYAFPHAKAWAIYWSFLIVEGLGYLYLPGVYGKGKYIPHLGKQLDYYCSAVWSWYITIAVALGLHFSGLFKLYTLVDEFGPLMSVAILSGFLISAVAYASALARGAQHRMTGNHVYDFFMGAELNPRLFGWLDFKVRRNGILPFSSQKTSLLNRWPDVL